MNVPNTHCCRCFTEEPSLQFTRRTSTKIGGMRLKHQIDVPMCKNCHKRATIRGFVETATGIAAVVLCLVIISLLVQLIENNDIEISPVSIIGIAIAGIVGGMVIAFGAFRLFMGKDYMKVALRMGGIVKVKFTNPQYQMLFAEKNPMLFPPQHGKKKKKKY